MGTKDKDYRNKRDKYQQMGGPEGVRKNILTAAISSGNMKNMRADDIARAAGISTSDKKSMEHIHTQLKRREAREK